MVLAGAIEAPPTAVAVGAAGIGVIRASTGAKKWMRWKAIRPSTVDEHGKVVRVGATWTLPRNSGVGFGCESLNNGWAPLVWGAAGYK